LDDLAALSEPVRAEEPRPPVKGAAEWGREIKAAYEGGLEEGRAEGLAEGLKEGRAEGIVEGRREEAKRLSSVIRALEEALFLVRMAEDHRLSVVEDNLAALAVAIARQIVGRELRGEPDAIADMVRRALVEFPIDQPLRVRLSPQDLSTIAALSTRSGEAIPIAPGRDLRWLADPMLEPGSCVVEGKERIVDGRTDRALERIYRSLIGD
jgi:flagellar biosynthesis/type III secretory pathway protein FliH